MKRFLINCTITVYTCDGIIFNGDFICDINRRYNGRHIYHSLRHRTDRRYWSLAGRIIYFYDRRNLLRVCIKMKMSSTLNNSSNIYIFIFLFFLYSVEIVLLRFRRSRWRIFTYVIWFLSDKNIQFYKQIIVYFVYNSVNSNNKQKNACDILYFFLVTEKIL